MNRQLERQVAVSEVFKTKKGGVLREWVVAISVLLTLLVSEF